MDVEKVFHMNGGHGEQSYSQNSHLQKKASDMVKHITLKSLAEACVSTTPESLGIADLGCSSGKNTLLTIREMVEVIDKTTSNTPPPEYRVYLNDLPTNDFKALFKILPDFYKELNSERHIRCQKQVSNVFIAGCPGTFYGRLFPNKCLHFIYSTTSLHWLSRGEVKQEKVDEYNTHFYAPSRNELEDEVKKEGSFEVERFEMFENERYSGPYMSHGTAVARAIRAIQESLISEHFGEKILDKLFDNYGNLIDQEMATEDIKPIIFIVVLKKI